ncbi:MAG: hypothetical protein FWD75_06600 [Propionibacteriaceae bacterium]|nr:hypothetical protein [Propionibacteriaceae bacterium]
MFGTDQCTACGASLKGGHTCPAGDRTPDLADLGPLQQVLDDTTGGADTPTGRALLLDPARTGPTPVVSTTDTMHTAHTQVMDYLFDNLDHANLAQRVSDNLGEPIVDAYTLPVSMEKARTHCRARSGTDCVVLAGTPGTGPRLVALTGGFDKTGSFKVGRHGTFTATNLSDHLIEDVVQPWFLSEHPDYDPDTRNTATAVFRDLRDPVLGEPRFKDRWDESIIDWHLLKMAYHGWTGTQMDSVLVRDRPTDYDPDDRRDQIATHATDPAYVRGGVHQWLEAHPERDDGVTRDWLDEDLTSTSDRARRARVLRDYRAFLTQVCAGEQERADTMSQTGGPR